jgi:SAM-dependent methyltransferase
MLSVFHNAISKLRSDGIVHTSRYAIHWLSEKFAEWRLGIRSSERIRLNDIGVVRPGKQWHKYEASNYATLKCVLKELDIQADRDVFLDYGSGKGRVVIMAARHPFKKVIGVEISEKLNAIARENVRNVRSKLSCKDVVLVTANAVEYRFPDEVNVVYMFNPFHGEPLDAVVRTIRDSLKKVPRKLQIVYEYPRWADNPFENKEHFIVRKDISIASRASSSRVRIYENVSRTEAS